MLWPYYEHVHFAGACWLVILSQACDRKRKRLAVKQSCEERNLAGHSHQKSLRKFGVAVTRDGQKCVLDIKSQDTHTPAYTSHRKQGNAV